MQSQSTSTAELFARCPKPQDDSFVVFNYKNSKQRKELLHWCRDNWDSTFKKSLDQSNTIFYHDCCTSFSRRGFCKIAGHPPLQTSSVMRIPSFKTVTSADNLNRWLLGVFSLNAKRGQRSYFPSINRYHIEEDILAKESSEEDDSMLKKRVQELCDKVETVFSSKITELEKANQVLLCSTKNWAQKYQELMDSQTTCFPPDLLTPVKRKNRVIDVFDDNYYFDVV